MKGEVLFVALGLIGMAISGPTFENCDTMLDGIPENINLHEVMGGWYYIRKGPIAPEVSQLGTFDCMTSTLWKDYKGPENVLNHLHHIRKDGKTHIAKMMTFDMVSSADEGMVMNNFPAEKSVQLPHGGEIHIDIQEKLVETDGGKTWSLWAACIQKDGGNSTVVWSVKSRYPKMDAMVEQMVVEKVETMGGVMTSEMRGIGQSNCH